MTFKVGDRVRYKGIGTPTRWLRLREGEVVVSGPFLIRVRYDGTFSDPEQDSFNRDVGLGCFASSLELVDTSFEYQPNQEGDRDDDL